VYRAGRTRVDLQEGAIQMGLEDIGDKAKGVIEDRGGVDALKEDAMEVKDDVAQEGSLADKAKNVVEDVKDPGAPGD
jgi:hypothetical protein